MWVMVENPKVDTIILEVIKKEIKHSR